jgi:ribosomal protein S18 acetylase RimI-like enzyme
MAIIVADNRGVCVWVLDGRMTGGKRQFRDLASVRRFEAAGFRAWPATSVHYDGAWAVRLTGGHPAKRLKERIARASRRFDAYGRPLTFRMSPLASPKITAYLDEQNWSRFDESLVMRVALTSEMVSSALDQIPLKDMGRFISAAIAIRNVDPALRPGLSEVISMIQPEAGLFVLENEDQPVSTAICVRDGDLAGLFEIATQASERGKGHGRRTILSALKWAQAHGARQAWLQVEAANEAAIGLYRSLGFEEVYRYHYRRLPDAQTEGH